MTLCKCLKTWFLQTQALVCWWPVERFLLSWQAFVINHKQVGVRYYSPLRNCLLYLHVGLDCEPEHSLSWHFDPRAQTLSVSFIRCQDFALWYLLMMNSYICCADLMTESPEIQESSIAVFHWCEDRDFGVFKSWEALRRRHLGPWSSALN